MAWTLYLYTHNASTEGIEKVRVRYTPYGSLGSGSKNFDMTDTSTSIGSGNGKGHMLEDIAQDTISFSCTTITTGYQFVCWHYTIKGGIDGSGTVYDNNATDSSSTFTYDLPEADGVIQIWPEAEGSPVVWTTNNLANTYSDLASTQNFSFSLDTYEVYRAQFSCAFDGTVTVYATSNIDTKGFLSTSTEFDEATGKPINYLIDDDDSGDNNNFSITYNVTAGTIYNIWTRSYDGTDTGTIRVYIVPPAPTWTVNNTNYTSELTDKVSSSISLEQYNVQRIQFTCKNSGTLTAYTTGSYDTIGYLTTSSSIGSDGIPSGTILAQDDSSGDGENFSLTYNVAAGQTYYLWVRMYDGANSGSVTYYISPPTTANSLYVYTSESWKKVTPYIYRSSSWTKYTANLYTNSTWK